MTNRTAIWTDFGGVLTEPVSSTFAAFSARYDIPERALKDAMDLVGKEHGTDAMGVLDRPLLSEDEWAAAVEQILREEYWVDVDLSNFGDRWFHDRTPNQAWIDELRRYRDAGHFVGLMSNLPPSWERHVRAMVPDDLFNGWLLSHSAGCRKPESEMFKLAEMETGWASNILIDDLAVNCDGATSAGWKAVHYRTLDQAVDDLRSAVGEAQSALAPDEVAAIRGRQGLRFASTIDKELVHRRNNSEVLLSQFSSIDDDTFAGTGMIPTSHRYFGDGVGGPKAARELAVFECVRQLLLCALHRHHGATPDMKSITATCEIHLMDGANGVPQEGDEVTMIGHVRKLRLREDVTTRVVHEVEAYLNGSPGYRVTVDTAQKPADLYQQIRLSQRATNPPMSDQMELDPIGRVSPEEVGVSHPANVVVRSPIISDDAITLSLVIPFDDHAFFDHPHDHVPGPLLMEAAVQAARYAALRRHGMAPATIAIASVSATYEQFAELDANLTLSVQQSGCTDEIYVVKFEEPQGAGVATLHVTLRFDGADG